MINGAKQFITNAGTDISGMVTITAQTGATDEISNLLVPNGTPGYELGEPYRKMGWNASDTRPLTFEAAACPRRTCSARAARASSSSCRCSRSGASASRPWGSGSPRARWTRRWPTPRSARPSASRSRTFQAIQIKLADMATEIEAARLLTYKAALLKDRGPRLHHDRRPGQAEDRPPGGARRRGGRPDPRRLRLHRGVPGVPHVPRREDPHDRRGHRRGPADGDRPGARARSRPRCLERARRQPRGDRGAGRSDAARGSGSARSPSARRPTPTRRTCASPTPRHDRAAAGRPSPTCAPRRSSRRRCARAPRRSTPATASCPSAPTFARACAEAGLVFVGPAAGGDRAAGRQGRGQAARRRAGVPVVPGIERAGPERRGDPRLGRATTRRSR